MHFLYFTAPYFMSHCIPLLSNRPHSTQFTSFHLTSPRSTTLHQTLSPSTPPHATYTPPHPIPRHPTLLNRSSLLHRDGRIDVSGFQTSFTYNPRQKSWHACPLFQYLSRQFISSPPSPNSMLFIVMKLSLLVSNIVGGEGGSSIQ